MPSTTTPIATSAIAAGRERPRAAPAPITRVSTPSSRSATELRSNPVWEQPSASFGFES